MGVGHFRLWCCAVGLLLTASRVAPGGNAEPSKPFVQRIPYSDVAFEMMPIPGGTFRMGSPAGERGRKPDEGPQVEVEVEPFHMGRFEVTWPEYETFLRQFHRLAARPLERQAVPVARLADAVTYPTPLYELEVGPMLERMGRGKGFPAVAMSHFAARQYTKWLSKKTGRFYRLPTEAEWEYACRAGTTTPFNTGADDAAMKDAGWYLDNSALADGDGAYREVGRKKPNAWGLYDMHGNVAEWCVDAYSAEGYARFAGRKVKAAEVINWPTKRYGRIIRGGGWESDAVDCRSAARARSDPQMNAVDPDLPKSVFWEANTFWVGFRVVCPAREPTEAEKLRFWNVDDPTTAEAMKLREERQMRDLVDRAAPPEENTP